MGSGSRREQECITRLEWTVDLDILSKVSSRTYKFTSTGKRLVSQLDKYYAKYLETGYVDQALQKVDVRYGSVQGPLYWEYEGETLNERRRRLEQGDD